MQAYAAVYKQREKLLPIGLNWSGLTAAMSRSTLASTAPLAMILLVGAFLSYRSHAILRQDRDMVVHTYQVLGAARAAMQAAGDAETAERGFVITGDPSILVPYIKAKKQSIPATMADLDRLLIQNGAQQKRLARLRRLIDEEFDDIQTTVEARRDQNFEAARVLVTAEQRKRTVDEIRALVSEMDNEEQKLLKQRSRNAAASEERILWVAALTAALSLTTRILIAIKVFRGKRDLP
jgi:CHASE3 domain sensor protein